MASTKQLTARIWQQLVTLCHSQYASCKDVGTPQYCHSTWNINHHLMLDLQIDNPATTTTCFNFSARCFFCSCFELSQFLQMSHICESGFFYRPDENFLWCTSLGLWYLLGLNQSSKFNQNHSPNRQLLRCYSYALNLTHYETYTQNLDRISLDDWFGASIEQ